MAVWRWRGREGGGLGEGDLGTEAQRGECFPREVAQFLLKMPGIDDVQVAGIAREEYGEEVGTRVIVADGASVGEEDV